MKNSEQERTITKANNEKVEKMNKLPVNLSIDVSACLEAEITLRVLILTGQRKRNAFRCSTCRRKCLIMRDILKIFEPIRHRLHELISKRDENPLLATRIPKVAIQDLDLTLDEDLVREFKDQDPARREEIELWIEENSNLILYKARKVAQEYWEEDCMIFSLATVLLETILDNYSPDKKYLRDLLKDHISALERAVEEKEKPFRSELESLELL